MRLSQLDISGFKSFPQKTTLSFPSPISAVVGPNGSGKSNIVDALRFVLGEQSFKSLRGRRGEDLIFGGSETLGRAYKAWVDLSFDNTDRTLNIDYDTVTIRREVTRDGENQYRLNGSRVRLRDIYDLLSAAHIGASGHHIISQGEADRILAATPRERKTIIEESLGLKVYRWKIAESEKKLARTEENMREAELRRRELAPHLSYLKKQVERMHKAREMRRDLSERYREYLRREDAYLTYRAQDLAEKREMPERKRTEVDARIAELSRRIEDNTDRAKADKLEAKIREIREHAQKMRSEKDACSRDLGRIDGTIEALRAEADRKNVPAPTAEDSDTAEGTDTQYVTVEANGFTQELAALDAHVNDAITEEDGAKVRTFLTHIQNSAERLRSFVEVSSSSQTPETREEEDERDIDAERAEVERQRDELASRIEAYEAREKEDAQKEEELRAQQEALRGEVQEVQRELYELKSTRSEINTKLQEVEAEERTLARDREAFAQEREYAKALVGSDIADAYQAYEIDEEEMRHEPRQAQRDRLTEIERRKVRLEDMDSGSDDEALENEYARVQEHDAFLEREITDLSNTAESLRGLITELGEKLDTEFADGLQKINGSFNAFFTTMFGGGTARLERVQIAPKKGSGSDGQDGTLAENTHAESGGGEKHEKEEGVEIRVDLPRKKITGLEMLSGGERALTALALLFAMTQVTPPPFLVLDETDAALDEANSRKYGDMLEMLASRSQLMLITHNRETMARAGAIYGITIGPDAASRVLSVKFEEAAEMTEGG